MKKIIVIVLLLCAIGQVSARRQGPAPQSDRKYWTDLAYRISEPILSNMSRGELKRNMVVEYSPTWDGRNKNVAYMEAFGRLMAGIAPWLALPDDDTAEGKQRKQLREWALLSYAHSVDPDSPDYLLWGGPIQPLVDAAYIANSFIRAPQALWEPLDALTKERYVEHFKGLRKVGPPYNNWLLFRMMIEAFLMMAGEEYDGFVMNVGMRKINEWYLGDGWYGDGPEFSLDYYNAYVIHPMVVEIADVMRSKKVWSPVGFDLLLRRMQRYDRLIERLISPEATFPAVGRSSTYRMGAFQTLALSSWKYGLHEKLSNGQVRSALTAVMRRLFSNPSNFDSEGYLRLGFHGYQPDLADYYTNTGSLYITSLVFLPLGLSPDHAFWTDAPQKWTSQRAWAGEPFPRDYHESIMR